MVTERQGISGRDPRLGPWVLTTVLALIGMPAVGAAAPPEARPIHLSDAAERGAFNVGAAQATVRPLADPTAGDVLQLDYTLPRFGITTT